VLHSSRFKYLKNFYIGFKLHLILSNLNEIVACKLTRGHVHDPKPLPQLTKNLLGKLLADKGCIGKNWLQSCYAVA